MGSIGAVKFLQVVKNLEKILSIELICSSQAYDFLKPLSSGKKIEDYHNYIRTKISHCDNDKVFIDDMKEAEIIIKSKKLIELTSRKMDTKNFIEKYANHPNYKSPTGNTLHAKSWQLKHL